MAYTSITDAIKGVLGSGFSYVRGFNLDPSVGPIHHGIDISTTAGKPIPAFESGTVIFSAFAGGGGTGYVHPYAPPTNASLANQFAATGGGNTVVVQDSTGLEHIYAHLSALDVKVGDAVTAGNVIGNAGDTGDATGVHLHYGVFSPSSGQFLDPTSYLEDAGNSFTQYLATLTKLGISTDPNHTITAAEATKIVDNYGTVTGSNRDTLISQFTGKSVAQLGTFTNNLQGNSFFGTPNTPIDPFAGLSSAISGVGLFVGFIFVGIALLLVAALASRNSAPATT